MDLGRFVMDQWWMVWWVVEYWFVFHWVTDWVLVCVSLGDFFDQVVAGFSSPTPLTSPQLFS